MLYLTGSKNLHDESDYEDPCASLNIPANKHFQRPNIDFEKQNKSQFDHDSQDDEFNQ